MIGLLLLESELMQKRGQTEHFSHWPLIYFFKFAQFFFPEKHK